MRGFYHLYSYRPLFYLLMQVREVTRETVKRALGTFSDAASLGSFGLRMVPHEGRVLPCPPPLRPKGV